MVDENLTWIDHITLVENKLSCLNLMFKVKKGLISDAFQKKFNMILHDYFTKKSMCNFNEPRFSLKVTKFAISSPGPRPWNKNLDNNTKAFTSYSLFQTSIKNRLINVKNVVLFFSLISKTEYLNF